MQEQDNANERSDGEGPVAETGAITRAAPTEPSRVTRQIATTDRRSTAQAATLAQRERINTLVGALGDPNHPLHQRAVEDLVTIGTTAVPSLCEALNPQRPWLTAYRAAEALGRIEDGRAAGPLLDALRHPNSNVRWSAVRALASVGDARALLELRRVARSDQSRTSWGESVGGAAQSVLDQMQDRNLIFRSADLIKTATACVFMLVALILAWSFVTTLQEELRNIGQVSAEARNLTPIVRTAEPTIPRPTVQPRPTIQLLPTVTSAVAAPAIAPDAVIAGVIASGNVRSEPIRAGNNVIGAVTEGDEVIVISVTSDQQWYRIALGTRRSNASQINSPDQSGWVARSLLTPIVGQVPIEDPFPTPAPLPTALPQPEQPTPEQPPALPTLTPVP